MNKEWSELNKTMQAQMLMVIIVRRLLILFGIFFALKISLRIQ